MGWQNENVSALRFERINSQQGTYYGLISMKLTDDLPKWITWPVRIVVYAVVLLVLLGLILTVVQGRAVRNAVECSEVTAANAKGLKYAQDMVACLRQKNGILENLLMRSVYKAIDATPNAPREFVGTWNASQPRCSYRHKLEANGEFTSEPMGCSLSAETFHGVWGVYDNRMIWLADEGGVWPPDINPMDVVDKDFFLLVEQDGTRTKFTRASADSANAVAAEPVQGSPDWAIARGYDWARNNDIRRHAACGQQWTDENHESLERLGCSKYVTEVNVLNVIKPIPVHNGWDDGTTTAECVAAVHAYWDPIVADMREKGEDHVAASRMSRDVIPALAECNNFDNIRIGRVVHEPQLRLNSILDKVKNGEPLTRQDKETVRKDYPGVKLFPENEYRTRYLNTAEELFRMAGGREQFLTGSEGEGPVFSECEIDGKVVRQEVPCSMETATRCMQGNAANEELHKRLDLLQAQGVGMVQRPPSRSLDPCQQRMVRVRKRIASFRCPGRSSGCGRSSKWKSMRSRQRNGIESPRRS